MILISFSFSSPQTGYWAHSLQWYIVKYTTIYNDAAYPSDYRIAVTLHNAYCTVCLCVFAHFSIRNFSIHWNELNIHSLNPEDFECNTIWPLIYTNWRDQIIIYSNSCPLFDANAVVYNSFKFRFGTLLIYWIILVPELCICKLFEFDPDFWSFFIAFFSFLLCLWKNSNEFKRGQKSIFCFHKKKWCHKNWNILSVQRNAERWNISFIPTIEMKNEWINWQIRKQQTYTNCNVKNVKETIRPLCH